MTWYLTTTTVTVTTIITVITFLLACLILWVVHGLCMVYGLYMGCYVCVCGLYMGCDPDLWHKHFSAQLNFPGIASNRTIPYPLTLTRLLYYSTTRLLYRFSSIQASSCLKKTMAATTWLPLIIATVFLQVYVTLCWIVRDSSGC